MKKDYIDIALTALAIVAALFAIFMLSWKLLGNSPTSEDVALSLVFILSSWLIILTYKFGKFEGRLVQLEGNIKDSFERVRGDFSRLGEEIKESKKEIKEDLRDIKRKLK